MSKKYKFILTLPDDVEVDSAVEIEGHVAYPNYSQAEPVGYKGVFDTYEEAENCAAKFKIYKWTSAFYDSYYDAEEPGYYVSIYDAENTAAGALGVEPGELVFPHPDDFQIEELKVDGETVYKYLLFYNENCVYDSFEDGDFYFDTEERARCEAEYDLEEFEIEDEGESPYDLETLPILNVRIEEIQV